MKRILFILAFLPMAVIAQQGKTHTVQPKETLYSLARLYNITPRELADFNQIDINTGLKIGQEIKIPGKAVAAKAPVKPANTNPAPASQPAPASANAKVHIVKAKETLYGVSKLYNVTMDNIRKWNNLSSDNLQEGQSLIVSAGAAPAQAKPAPVAVTTTTTTVTSTTASNDLEAQKAELERQKRELELKEQKLREQEEARAKAEEKRRQEEEAKRAQAEAAKQRKQQDQETITTFNKPTEEITKPAGKFNGGQFKSLYTGKLGVLENGTAGIFKSTSGWNDGKFYCLHDKAPIGSIVKITNKRNGAVVYAKVLDVVPVLKQNQNILVRLSNSAAAELGNGEENFDCSVEY